MLAVGTQYLLALADAAQIENARALEKADEVHLQQATDSHDAGVGTNLDVLRARVQLQTQQQALINAENTFAKDKIALNRLIGLAGGPGDYADGYGSVRGVCELPLSDAMALAFQRRKDLLDLQAQIEVATQTRKAVRAERLPTLAFGGYYGVVGEIGGLYHGVVRGAGEGAGSGVQGSAAARENEVAGAQVTALQQQMRVAQGNDRVADSFGDAGCAVVERAGEGGAEQCRSGDAGAAGRDRPVHGGCG